MKKLLFLFFLLTTPFSLKSQGILSLDSCRALAIANNKELLISGEKINAAHYQKKAAFTNYLPNFSATGAYMRNQKEFSLLNDDDKVALSGLGTSVSGPLASCRSHRTAASGTGPHAFTIGRSHCPGAQRSRNCNCRRIPHRYPKCICRSHHPHPTVIYGWQDTCIQ